MAGGEGMPSGYPDLPDFEDDSWADLQEATDFDEMRRRYRPDAEDAGGEDAGAESGAEDDADTASEGGFEAGDNGSQSTGAETTNDTEAPEPVGGEGPEEGLDAEAEGATGEDHERESIEEVMKSVGHKALILTQASSEDQRNILYDAISMREKKLSSGKASLLFRFPVVGRVVKAALIAKGRGKAKQAIAEGDYEAAYRALGVDAKDSRMMQGGQGNSAERAWQALQNAGYTDDHEVEKATSRLDDSESVEKLSEDAQQKVKGALSDYFEAARKGEKSPEELDKEFDAQIREAMKGDTSLLHSLRERRESIKKLAADERYSQEEVQDYLENHVTLYKAIMKEGTYTQRKVDNVVKAVALGGAAGAVAYALLARQSQSTARSAIGSVVGAGGVGAAAGAVFGAMSGIGRARAKLADAEIEQATAGRAQVEVEAEGQDGAEIEPDAEAEGETEGEVSENSTAEGSEEQAEGAAQAERTRRGGILGVFASIERFKGKLTSEQKHLAKIEELRDRKDAAGYIDEITELMDDFSDEGKARKHDLYVDILARSRVSRDQKIDLIRYDNNRAELEAALKALERDMIDENGVEVDFDAALADPESNLSKDIAARTQELMDKVQEANQERRKYIAKTAVVEGIIGAATGFAAGAIVQRIRGALAPEEANAAGGTEQPPEPAEGVMPNGSETVEVNGEQLTMNELIDRVNEDYNDGDGRLSDETLAALRAAGFRYNISTTTESVQGATSPESVRDFFNSSNADANGLTTITGRTWQQSTPGAIYSPVANGDGDIIIQVGSGSSGVNVDDMTLSLSPGGGGGTALTFDVAPDGTVTIPADSPARSLFEGTDLRYGYAELGQHSGDGHFNVFATIGGGRVPGDDVVVNVPNDAAVLTMNSYEIVADNGESISLTPAQDYIRDASFMALHGHFPEKGTGEVSGMQFTGENTTLHTASGEEVTIDHAEHSGGYQPADDTYYAVKRGVTYSGASIIDRMNDEHLGLNRSSGSMSIAEADGAFMRALESGDIAEGDVVEAYLDNISGSPESIVSLRALMGDLQVDLDGDGIPDLIDTQQEINDLASIISSGDAEGYDAFVNDTLGMFYDKLDGGSIEVMDLASNPYQYTTWSELLSGGDIFQRMGQGGSGNGISLILRDSSGQSIYDETVLRRVFGLPDGYKIDYVGPRLDCGGQTVVHISPLEQVVQEAVSQPDEPQPDQPQPEQPSQPSQPSQPQPEPEQPSQPQQPTPEPEQPTPEPEQPTPEPEQPTPEPEEHIIPKDADRIEELDQSANAQDAEDRNTGGYDNFYAEQDQPKTEIPSESVPQDYGTAPDIKPNSAATGGGASDGGGASSDGGGGGGSAPSAPSAPVDVTSQVSPQNDYSQNLGGANSGGGSSAPSGGGGGGTSFAAPDTGGQAAANAAAAAPGDAGVPSDAGSSTLDDIMGEFGG